MDVSAAAKALQADVLRLVTPHINPETREFIANLRRAARAVELVPADVIATAPSVLALPLAPSLRDLSSSNATLRRANLARLAAYASISVHLHEYIDDSCCRHYGPDNDEGWTEKDVDGQGEFASLFKLPSDKKKDDTATSDDKPKADAAAEVALDDSDDDSKKKADDIDNNTEDANAKDGESGDANIPDLTTDLASTLKLRANAALEDGNVTAYSQLMFRHCFTTCFELYFPNNSNEHTAAAGRGDLCTCGLNFCGSSSSSSSSAAPRQTLSSVLLPLLYSPSRTDAALAAIALHGVLRAAPTLDARAGLANGVAQELLNVLVAVSVAANPILVDHAARALRYSLESSTFAHLTIFAWQSPVQLMFDMMLEENCTQGGFETTYVAPEGGYYKGAEDTGDGARWRSPRDEKIPLYPSSFDNCFEIKLLGCIKTALTTIPSFSGTGGGRDNASGSFASSSDTFAFDLFSKAVGSLLSVVTESIECISSTIEIMPLLLEQAAISSHYAMTRCAALFLEIAPLIPRLFYALVGPDVYAYGSAKDDANSAASESNSTAGKSAGAVALSKEKATERLRRVTKLIRQPMRVLNSYALHLGMSMPYETPYHNDSLAHGTRDNRAPWTVFPDMEPAWSARVQAAVAAVKRGLPRAIAAQLVAVQREATQTLADHEAAVAAYNELTVKQVQAPAAQSDDNNNGDNDRETVGEKAAISGGDNVKDDDGFYPVDGDGGDNAKDDDDLYPADGDEDYNDGEHFGNNKDNDFSSVTIAPDKVSDAYILSMTTDATKEAAAPPASPLVQLLFETVGALLVSFLPIAELLPRTEYGFFVYYYVLGAAMGQAFKVSTLDGADCFFTRRAAVTRGALALVTRLASPQMLHMGTTVTAKALTFVDAIAASGALYPALHGLLKDGDARALRAWTQGGGLMHKGQMRTTGAYYPPTNDEEASEGTDGTEAMLVSLLSCEKLPASAKQKESGNINNNDGGGVTGDDPPPHPTELLRTHVICLVRRAIMHDFSPSAVPGLEALPRFVRCGLLNALANTMPTMPPRLRRATAALVPKIAAGMLLWDMYIDELTPYQWKWMKRYVGDPLLAMCNDGDFKALLKKRWTSTWSKARLELDMFLCSFVKVAEMMN